MRVFVATFAALSLVLVPQAAAAVDPQALVLRPADLPSGFRLDANESGLRTNAMESKSGDEAGRMIVRAGRVTGYKNEFRRGDKGMISSRADVLKTAAGARVVLSWFDREARKAGIGGLERSRVRIGTEAWLYSGQMPYILSLVVWRHDRIFAGVAGAFVSREQVLRLARTQQRRIAAALG